MDQAKLSIASVCRVWPCDARPQNGIFVRRRVEAQAGLTSVRVLKPSPWFPIVRPFETGSIQAATDESKVKHQRMFYIPGILKQWDAYWLERSIRPILDRWHRTDRLNLIDAHFGYPDGVGCWRWGRKRGVPVFITIRGVEAEQLKQPRIGQQLIDALRGCAGVIAVSDTLKAAAVDAGVPRDHITVIPNGIDAEDFAPGDCRESRRRLGLSTSSRLIVSVGNVRHVKGHELLIKAFVDVRERIGNAELVIIGSLKDEPRYVKSIRTLIHHHGLENCVKLIGAVAPNEVASWLRAADVFALASHREGCCNALLEAITCGVPVVVTDVGDNRQYVSSPEHGSLVPANDVVKLGQALVELLCRQRDHTRDSKTHLLPPWNDVAASVLQCFSTRIATNHLPQTSSPHSADMKW